MKVLVACEESQRVCSAFRELGHEAYSCDIQEPSGGHPEWHILGDALEAIKGGIIGTMDNQTHYIGRWELLIAHPPCTYLASSGTVRLFNPDHTIKSRIRELKGWEARAFFMRLLNAAIDKIAVENPAPLRYFGLPHYSQIIEPFYFGDPWRKRTCLWLKGLPELSPTAVVEPKGLWVRSTGGRDKEKKVYSKYTLSSNRDPKIRSKTFQGIARAMAEQWGGDIREK